jgi:hypothetical protein
MSETACLLVFAALLAQGWLCYWLGRRDGLAACRYSPPRVVRCDEMLRPFGTVRSFFAREKWSARST